MEKEMETSRADVPACVPACLREYHRKTLLSNLFLKHEMFQSKNCGISPDFWHEK